MQHNDELQALVTGWVAERPRAEILKVLDDFEVVCRQVNDASDIVEDPHYQVRTLVELTGSEALGRVLTPGPVLHVKDYAGPTYDGVPKRSASTPTRSSASSSADGRDGVQTYASGRRPTRSTASREPAASRTAAKASTGSRVRWRRLETRPRRPRLLGHV